MPASANSLLCSIWYFPKVWIFGGSFLHRQHSEIASLSIIFYHCVWPLPPKLFSSTIWVWCRPCSTFLSRLEGITTLEPLVEHPCFELMNPGPVSGLPVFNPLRTNATYLCPQRYPDWAQRHIGVAFANVSLRSNVAYLCPEFWTFKYQMSLVSHNVFQMCELHGVLQKNF